MLGLKTCSFSFLSDTNYRHAGPSDVILQLLDIPFPFSTFFFVFVSIISSDLSLAIISPIPWLHPGLLMSKSQQFFNIAFPFDLFSCSVSLGFSSCLHMLPHITPGQELVTLFYKGQGRKYHKACESQQGFYYTLFFTVVDDAVLSSEAVQAMPRSGFGWGSCIRQFNESNHILSAWLIVLTSELLLSLFVVS